MNTGEHPQTPGHGTGVPRHPLLMNYPATTWPGSSDMTILPHPPTKLPRSWYNNSASQFFYRLCNVANTLVQRENASSLSRHAHMEHGPASIVCTEIRETTPSRLESTSDKGDMQTSAAIDIGSNTIRVVVAHGSPDTLEVLATDEALVRIGESVNATGQISAQKRTDTLTVLRRHLALAAQYDAAPVLAIATEAIRKATDRDDFIAQIQHETGLTVQIIAGDVEAVLTFYGATYGLHHIPDAPTHVAVMDLGGGS